MNRRFEPLRKKEDITYVLRRGVRVHSPLFRLHHVMNETVTRLGIVIGKGVSKKAVERNRIRRRTREAFLRVLPHINQDVDVVILPTKKVLGAPFEDIVKYISKALR